MDDDVDPDAPEPNGPWRARFYFDFGSGSCLWATDTDTVERYDYMIEASDLPLSPATATEMERLVLRYDEALNWDDPMAPGPWRNRDCAEFNEAARALLASVRAELGGGWAITDEFSPISEHPGLDLYQDDPTAWNEAAGRS